jgi:pimeloyl-ACP methyl ester carboxylesterase
MNVKKLFEGKKIRVNGVELNVLIEGQGPSVVLLHGFPDSIALWRHQIPVLVREGYRVIAPDQRGFGLSEVPGDTKAYTIDNYVTDLAALMDALKVEKVCLVGHDWGAAVGWQFCMKHPERVDRYMAISLGHPTAYIKSPIKQKIKGYYIIFFQIKGFSEWLITRANWWLWRKMVRYDEEFERWKRELSRRDRLTAAINIYRANLKLMLTQDYSTVRVPVIGVWGEDDVALVEEQMMTSEEYVTGPWRYERMGEKCGHWVMLSVPEKFNALLLDYLKQDLHQKNEKNR